MKYVVWNTCNNSIVVCNSRTSAEELVLSIAEEEDFEEFNYGINICGDADTLEEELEEFRNQLKKYEYTNECICLYIGGYNYCIRTVPSLED